MRLTTPLPPGWESGRDLLTQAALPEVRRQLKTGGGPAFPLVPQAAATGVLGRDARGLRALVDLGYLVAFNIAAGSHNPELRFLAASLRQFKTSHGREPFREQWAGICRHIIPYQCACLTGREIQRALNCHRSVVQALILNSELCQMRPAFPGPGGSCVVTRPSFEAFLQDRQL